MPTFPAPDGTELAYTTHGSGDPVVCLPGGPMQASRYLDDLGGLSAYRRLVRLDLRGTGESATPTDLSTYRCDRMVDDVEALRRELGLERLDLLGHSAGASLATLYAARYPGKVARMALVTPSTRSVGIPITGETRRAEALRRRHEPWFPVSFAALEAVTTGTGDEADWTQLAPFFYGRWDRAAQEHAAARDGQTNHEAAEIFAGDDVFTPEATRAALAAVTAPVLLLGGEVDLNTPVRAVTEYASLFPAATAMVQSGAGHFPWLDDPDQFVTALATFFR